MYAVTALLGFDRYRFTTHAPAEGTPATFGDTFAARGFLRRLARDTAGEASIRRALALVLDPVASLSDGEVIDRLAHHLYTRHVIVTPLSPPPIAAAPQRVSDRPVAASQQKSWIEILILDDTTGDPVPNVKLGVALPTKDSTPQTTKADGRLHFDPCERGTCVVDTSFDGIWLGNVLELRGIGEVSHEPVSGVPFDDPKRRPKTIVQVSRHRVRTGETLDSVARAAGLTWRALAKFNFDTDDPNKLDKALGRQVGCTKRTKDKKNYLFDDSDAPGILYIPRPASTWSFETGYIHPMRVVPLTHERQHFFFSY